MPFVNPRLAAQIQRRTEGYAYTDTAVYIAAPSLASLDAYGQPTTAGTETTIDCSFTDKPASERWRDYVDVSELAGEIRFVSPRPSKGGKVRITKRFDEAVTAQTFEIIGIQDRGRFGYLCALKAASV